MPRTWESTDGFEAFLNVGGIVEPDDAMPPEYRRTVFRWIERQANSELMAAVTLGQQVPTAPGLRQKRKRLVAAQDRLAEAHLLYSVAAGLGLKARNQMLEDLFAGKTGFDARFHRPPGTWTDQVIVALLVESADVVDRRAVLRSCSYGPARRALEQLVASAEERSAAGEQWFARVVARAAARTDDLQASLDAWWWPVLGRFDLDGSSGRGLARWHIRTESGDDVRDGWLHRVVPSLQGAGLVPPDPELEYEENTARWRTGTPSQDVVILDDPDVDSARTIAEMSGNWQRTAWVRRAMDRPARTELLEAAL